ncbi:MAG: threonine/serine exporter [Clostridiales bacterium]|nr:threonine/serine exporter [Clostridiales bacterium]
MNWMIELLACFVATAAFSVLVHQPRNTVLVSALIGTASYGVYLLLNQTTIAYFVASLLIGTCCEICARLMKRTATLFVSVAIIPLVPGVGLYRTMRFITEGNYLQAVTTGSATLLGLCAIALAVTATSMFFRAFKKKEGAC